MHNYSHESAAKFRILARYIIMAFIVMASAAKFCILARYMIMAYIVMASAAKFRVLARCLPTHANES